MKLAVVVQRYGPEISGGAELHARYIAEHLGRHAEVEVLTTCARDYLTWRNEFPTGEDRVNGVTVRRFPVRHERNPAEFGARSTRVFEHQHSLADELRWLESEGPASPELIDFIRRARARYDYFLFFSYRYYHAYHGIASVPDRAVLVPTAERDPALGLALFRPVFRGVRAIMYNSFEERRMIQEVAGNGGVRGVVVGVGSEIPDTVEPEAFRRKYDLPGRFAVYVGRIDANKGCTDLFEYFQQYAAQHPRGLSLLLIGHPVIDVPISRRMRHLGFLSDEDKFNAMAAADVLIMPSRYESLSMVTLEAWALGRPVLVNGRCDVLRGQCLRSNGGLYYETASEFVEALRVLEANRRVNTTLGAQGRAYYRRHYDWPVIERKYLDVLTQLSQEDRDGTIHRGRLLPGWLARRRRREIAADEVLAGISAGPVPLRRGVAAAQA